jgi:hypothetical protein
MSKDEESDPPEEFDLDDEDLSILGDIWDEIAEEDDNRKSDDPV